MITEDYVSFETAKLLKEKGFDEECFAYYYVMPHKTVIAYDKDFPKNSDLSLIYTNLEFGSLPTLQMAMKWLRETHKIFFNVNYYNLDIGNEWLQIIINRPNKIGCEASFEGFGLEEQYEEAIKYCLENLI